MNEPSAMELFRAGKLDDAVDAAIAAVRKKPTDAQGRLFLAELFCFQGNLERADTQLETILTQTPDAIRVLQFRQIIRAEKTRQEFHSEGRAPEFLTDPPAHLELLLKASVLRRDGDNSAAQAASAEAESQRPVIRGTCNGNAFEGFRDLNDTTASFFEVLTNSGTYYWVPFEHVKEIEFTAPEAPRDLLWRRVRLSVHDGPDGDVCIPATYVGTARQDDDDLRLARGTDWQEKDGVYFGAGQTCYLVGEEDVSCLELATLEFSTT